MAGTFDINIDCGESFGNWVMGADEALMPHVTTANVACGFHAGDPMTMMKTIALAKDNGVAVGSHPGLPDLMGFGRRVMAITPDELYAYVVYQTGALRAALEANGMALHHVKPHGALYRMLNDDEALGEAFARAVIDLCPAPMIYYPAPVERHAVTKIAAEMGIDVVPELYFDLPYEDDGTLALKRSNEGADLDETRQKLCLFPGYREYPQHQRYACADLGPQHLPARRRTQCGRSRHDHRRDAHRARLCAAAAGARADDTAPSRRVAQ